MAVTKPFLREAASRSLSQIQLWLNHTNLLPDFIIIGAQKCGTSSLYEYLVQHPCIASAKGYLASNKEVRYFNRYYDKGVTWYRGHFPSYFHKTYFRITQHSNLITGESSPSYIFHPHAPKRVFKVVPRAKLIVLLRNPVDRAFSHYQHVVRLGKEDLSFEVAIKAEPERLKGEKEKIMSDEHYLSFNYSYHSYLTRGIYVDQLKSWFNIFPKEQMLILNSEQFFADPNEHFKRVVKFLNLPDWTLEEYKKANQGRYETMDKSVRASLNAYFEPHTRALYELIGQEYEWQ